MVALTRQEKEVVERFQQLAPDRRREVMQAMFRTDADHWRAYQREGEEQLRKLASQRGIDWNQLDDEKRQEFVNELLHEDHP